MSGDTLFVFILLLVTVALFVSDRLRLDVVAIIVILALMLSGVLSPAEAVAGFGDTVVLLIAGLFVVGEGLFRTGVAFALGHWMSRVAGTGETRLLVLLMLVVAGLSAFMSSTGAVAIFIPVALNLAARAGISPSRLLMPMAYASLIGGMLTLIGTPPNLVVSTQLQSHGLEPFQFLSFTPIGLLILVVGVLYVLTLGRRLLPERQGEMGLGSEQLSIRDLLQSYHREDRLHGLRIPQHAILAGQTVTEALLRSRYEVTVLGMEHQHRHHKSLHPALAGERYRGGDLLYVMGRPADVAHLASAEGLERIELDQQQLQQAAQEFGLVEVLVGPRSSLVGRDLRKARFRDHYNLNVLGLLRRGEALDGPLNQIQLAVGDSLLLGGGWPQIRQLQQSQDDVLVLSVPKEIDEIAPNRQHAPRALAILAGMLILMGFNLVPSVTAVLLAALAMVLSGCLGMNRAYGAMNWQSLVLIAGMLPMATALEKTGGVTLIVNGLVGSLGAMGPMALMTGLFVLTSVFSQFISNTATTVLVAPIAIGAAEGLGLSPYPFMMTVAIAASTAFATPVASPVNTLVLGPGGYRFNDFVKVGMPLQLLALIVTLLAVPVVFPL